jgi:hypothetical protein
VRVILCFFGLHRWSEWFRDRDECILSGSCYGEVRFCRASGCGKEQHRCCMIA